MPRLEADGDAKRFNALYADNAKDILAYLLRRTPTPEDAADHLAETFLIAWAKRDSIPVDPTDDPVLTALNALSPVDREIITLMSWDQLAPREVAQVLGLSANVVRVRAHRARARLRTSVTEAGVQRQEPPVPRSIGASKL